MKRYGNLFDMIISTDNLNLADLKARHGKGESRGVQIHDVNREANIAMLHEMLKNGTYRTSRYETFTVDEPKERLIYRLPYYPDRIVHHAIMNIVEPIWMKSMTRDTCACIKKRGINEARKLMMSYMKDRDGTRYCLKTDIRKFYPSIDHEIMKSVVRRKIKDVRLLSLLDEIIDSSEGLPIGNYLSQHMSNLYLSRIDHRIKEVLKVRYYIRYADDMVFLAESKERLAEILEFLRKELSEVNLQLKGNEQIYPVSENRYDRSGRGIDFVGFVFYHGQTLIRKSIKKNFARRCARLNRAGVTGKPYKMAVSAWLGWTKYSNSNNLLNTLIHNNFNYEKSSLHQ